MPDVQIEVFRSAFRAECHDRAFMLAAVGISSAIGFDRDSYLLTVDPAVAALAVDQLRSYAAESRPAPPAVEPRQPKPNAWVGCVIYVAVLLLVGFAIANGWWRLDAFDVGALDAEQVQHGQWWRAWTALTLHLDGPHLIANLGAGIWFGFLAAREIGSGSTWLLVVTGAALANLFEGSFGPPWHRAVGASTAVFTALGLLVAYSWRLRRLLPQGWASRWAPLVAGALLLGWFGTGGDGTGGDGTDIVAHVLGFAFGCLLGVAAALPRVQALLDRVPQWVAGIAALAQLAIAWSCAILRG
jgi:membrane associated rhomboid family serine protease